MFAYIDERIVGLLKDESKLVHLDAHGKKVTCDDQSAKPYLSMVGPVPLPTNLATEETTFSWYAFVRRSELSQIHDVADRVKKQGLKDLWPLVSSYMAVNSLLIYGPFESASKPLVRVHSSCLTSDVLGSLRCECGPQLHAAAQRIVEEGVGALVYMSGHEGRGIGLWAKAITYLLQDLGEDTYEANISLGLPADSRDFKDAGVVLKALRPRGDGIRLLSNNPLKREDLMRAGINVVSMEPLVCGVNQHNRRYLKAKMSHGHVIPPALIEKTGRQE